MTVAVISLASREMADPDGKWTPMDWETEVDALFNGKYYHHELEDMHNNGINY